MRASAWVGCILAVALIGCQRAANNRVQGYVEGEFVYVASPQAGMLATLNVERSAQVTVGAPLFSLETNPERPARDEAAQRLSQARANLEDARKGRRPTELESLEAQLRQARAALQLSEAEFNRQDKLSLSGAGSREDFERARATLDQDRQKVSQFEADLQTARLGLRDDQIRAAEADVRAREAALVQAEWNLAQKQQTAPKAGLVFDTLYRPGDWVAAGKPAVVLLPPQNVKVRAFVAEDRVGTIQLGQTVRVVIDGTEPAQGRVSFVSPQAEYTPPVIYSRESRTKLVFLIEVRFDSPVAAKLHPGQPVDVEF